MMRIGAVLAIVYFVGMGILLKSTSQTEVLSIGRIPQNHSIVRLHTLEGQFFCSGVVVGRHTIFTAAHCVDGADQISVRGEDGKPLGVVAKVAGANGRADFAILRGDFRRFAARPADIDPRSIMKDIQSNKRKIIACGYPWAGKLFCSTVTDRVVMNFQIAGEGSLWPGMSGGPVIDAATGHVIGVNSAMSGSKMIFTPLVEIYAALDVSPE